MLVFIILDPIKSEGLIEGTNMTLFNLTASHQYINIAACVYGFILYWPSSYYNAYFVMWAI